MSDLSSRNGCGCGCSAGCGCGGNGGGMQWIWRQLLQLDLDHPSSVKLLLWKRQRIPGKQRLWM